MTGVWCFTIDNDNNQDQTANSGWLEVTEVEIVSFSDETERHVARHFETDTNNRTEANVIGRWLLVSRGVSQKLHTRGDGEVAGEF